MAVLHLPLSVWVPPKITSGSEFNKLDLAGSEELQHFSGSCTADLVMVRRMQPFGDSTKVL